uniref:Uncharacterized protein n=1 Tax=Heterorhabditis bacteriophora TaxID=37862 RepID=A0A1I7W687_HETBA
MFLKLIPYHFMLRLFRNAFLANSFVVDDYCCDHPD